MHRFLSAFPDAKTLLISPGEFPKWDKSKEMIDYGLMTVPVILRGGLQSFG